MRIHHTLLVLVCIPLFAYASGYSCYDSPSCRNAFQLTHEKCPGRFCGRPLSPDGKEVWGNQCMACKWGSRTDGWCCVQCTHGLVAYDALFLLFLFCGIVSVQASLLDIPYGRTSTPRTRKIKSILQFSALFEQILAALCTFVVLPPIGELHVSACPKDGEFSEWYSGFHNPAGYSCASEAIVPLYTAPLIHGGFCILFCLLFRLPLSVKLDNEGRVSIYGNLIGIPLLLIFHAVLGGVLYFGFAYIVIMAALLSMTVIMVTYGASKILMKGEARNPRPLLVLCGAYLYCAFAVASLLEYYLQPRYWWYFAMVFLLPMIPPLFLISTWKYTNPQRIL